MDFFNLSSSLLLSCLVFLPVLLLLLRPKRRFWASTGKLPPGPPGWPVFGHMFMLGTVPHATMARLKDKYGPVVWLQIGSNNTMVVLTAAAAAELFKNHDLSFGDRKLVETMRTHNYEKSSLALAPYNAYWRMLRRLCSMEIFVNRKINETVTVRRKCIDSMLSWIDKEASTANGKRGIHIAHFLFLASFNIIGNLVLSQDLVEPDSKMASEFYTAMMGIMHWPSRPNLSDLFDWLKPFDLQGLQRRMSRDVGKALDIVAGFVKERLKERQEGGEKGSKDFLDVLLDFEGRGADEPEKLSEHNISIFILEMFLAGGETTSNTVEWALAELLRNPEKMNKAKAEIQSVVGPNRKFEESDIENLPYLQAVIKETMRLHPPVPLLLPRSATKDTSFMGYTIPKNTQVWINVYAIGRDPETWNDPLSFTPERFLGSNIDYKGQHFELIPFGAGRRMCVGLSLGHRLLHLELGSLLHEFNWELEDSVTSKAIDMSEKMGMTVRKLEPLKAVPIKLVV